MRELDSGAVLPAHEAQIDRIGQAGGTDRLLDTQVSDGAAGYAETTGMGPAWKDELYSLLQTGLEKRKRRIRGMNLDVSPRESISVCRYGDGLRSEEKLS